MPAHNPLWVEEEGLSAQTGYFGNGKVGNCTAMPESVLVSVTLKFTGDLPPGFQDTFNSRLVVAFRTVGDFRARRNLE